MTPEQKEIIAFAQKNGGEFTKRQLVEAIGNNYYCNGEKHLGDRLSRMVNAQLLERVKPGVFKVGTGKKNKPSNIADGQANLFER